MDLNGHCNILCCQSSSVYLRVTPSLKMDRQYPVKPRLVLERPRHPSTYSTLQLGSQVKSFHAYGVDTNPVISGHGAEGNYCHDVRNFQTPAITDSDVPAHILIVYNNAPTNYHDKIHKTIEVPLYDQPSYTSYEVELSM